ncbi:MAG: threonine/serine exporter family protein [Gemella sp.]|nr:threonine/serine exporter family protein [Gemella sp.]
MSFTIIDLFIQFSLGFLITFAFAIFFNAPKKSLVACSLIGGITWIIYIFINKYYDDKVLATFIAATIMGLLADFCSRKYKMPATVFIYTGMIPLIPGYSLYYTMHHLVIKDYLIGTKSAIDTLLIAGAIAAGIFIASVFSASIKRVKLRRKR